MTNKMSLRLAVPVLAVLAALAGPAPGQTPHRLTLQEAIQEGLRNNLRLLAAQTQVQQAEGTRERQLARLFPRARVESFAAMQTRNLEAFGISIPGRPPLVGPFSTYDYRVSVDQPLFDLPSYHRWKAGQEQEQAARLSYQDIRDLIIRQVAGLYLDAQAAAARVEAAQARVTTAEELHRLARERHDAGVATGVDVLRAQVELANEQQRLLEARNAAQQTLLVLARAIGADLGTPIELADPLEFKAIAPPEIHAAVASAVNRRPDYLSLQAQQQALAQEEKSNRSRWLPRLSFNGNYGAIGRTPTNVLGTGALQGTLTFDLFDWDRKGERIEIESRQRRLEHQMADLRRGIEQEIRQAYLNLDSATEQVTVARAGRQLAERELELARERFQAGVSSNIEVTTAQEALARAQDNYILALTRHADARVATARALGATEEIYQHYLGLE
jgi:outer membrane protein TolC